VSKSLRNFPSALSLRDSSISSEYQTSLDRITAAQLLPIAATIVAAGTGAEVAEALPNPQHALGTLITSYVMWGMGVPLAMTVLVMYYQRLALHKLPPREVIVSCFLPLGPLGMGGYTIMYLGKVSRENFTQTHIISDVAGEVVYILGFFVALIMWGFGLVWLVFALATIYKCQPFPFNMGWWGFTFPLGVYAVSTITFGVEMPSQFFKIFGIVSTPLPTRSVRSDSLVQILSVAVILLWIVVALGTVKGAYSGELFYAPCVANLKPKQANGRPSIDSEKASQG
jgi:tellurite resistance protein TehA-like permease